MSIININTRVTLVSSIYRISLPLMVGNYAVARSEVDDKKKQQKQALVSRINKFRKGYSK